MLSVVAIPCRGAVGSGGMFSKLMIQVLRSIVENNKQLQN